MQSEIKEIVSNDCVGKKVIKRDGSLKDFDKNKIIIALRKAFEASGEDKTNMNKVLISIFSRLNKYFIENNTIHIEEIQDIIEEELVNFNLYKVARKYITYRNKRFENRIKKDVFKDISEIVRGYLDKTDWRVKENANSEYSYQGLMLYLSGLLQKEYWLSLYTEDVRKAHIDGYIHIHDLNQLTPYCSGWSLYDLILEGFNCTGKGAYSKPAKHLDSLFGQIVNFIGTLQNEWAGAQGLNSIDTLCAPFIYYDNLTYDEVKQSVQRLVYNLNTNSRWGGQCPFSNFTFDLKPSPNFAEMNVVVGGEIKNKKYKDFQKEMNMITKAFYEVLLEGDAQGNPFTFPIPTINITKDFDWDSELTNLIFKVSAKYGSSYFQNFINSDLSPEDVRSFCCRLRLDKTEIKKNLKNKTGGLFGAGDLTGSIGVVTINLPKLAYLSNKNEKTFFKLLKQYLNIAKESLEFKRDFLTKQYEKNLYPFTKRYLKDKGFTTYFSTIGVIGGNEACLNLLGKDILSEEGLFFMKRTLEFIRKILKEFQEETGNLYNLEATPGEGTCYRLAKIDKEKYGNDIITSGTIEHPYYTNSTQVPVDYTNTWEVIMHQNKLQPLYTGGTVLHIFLGEDLSNSVDSLKYFVKNVFEKTKLPYLSITPTFSVCKKHGNISGEHFNCPDCGEECLVYSRVVGYYRPVQSWNNGKQQEFVERDVFKI